MNWKRNGFRHSYISYRVAVLKDVPAVALECGNSPQVIFSNYRALATDVEAKEWFAILPPKPNATLPNVTITASSAAKVAGIRREVDDAWTIQRN